MGIEFLGAEGISPHSNCFLALHKQTCFAICLNSLLNLWSLIAFSTDLLVFLSFLPDTYSFQAYSIGRYPHYEEGQTGLSWNSRSYVIAFLGALYYFFKFVA